MLKFMHCRLQADLGAPAAAQRSSTTSGSPRVICYAFSVPATRFVSQVNRATSEPMLAAGRAGNGRARGDAAGGERLSDRLAPDRHRRVRLLLGDQHHHPEPGRVRHDQRGDERGHLDRLWRLALESNGSSKWTIVDQSTCRWRSRPPAPLRSPAARQRRDGNARRGNDFGRAPHLDRWDRT